MADKAHLATDKELEKVLRSLKIAKFDEANLIIPEQGTPSQKLKAVRKEANALIDALVLLIMAFMAGSILAIGAMAKRIHALNMAFMNDVLGVSADTKPKTPVLAKDFEKKARQEVKRVVENAIKNADNEELQRRINRTLQKYNNLVKLISRTEATRAENRARLDSMLEARRQGKHIKKKWVTLADLKVRELHKRIHGEVAELDDVFSNGLMYPADENGSPEQVVNCRCYIEPVIRPMF